MLSKDLAYWLNNLDDNNVSLVTQSSNVFQLGTSNVLAEKTLIFYDNSTNDVYVQMSSNGDLILKTYAELIVQGTTVSVDTTGGLLLAGSTVVIDSTNDLNLNSSALNIHCSSATIDSTNDININSSGFNLTPSSFNLTAGDDVEINSSAFKLYCSSMTIDTTNDININSSGFNLTPSSFTITSSDDIILNSSKLSINCSSMTIDSTNDITINSSGLNITPSSMNVTADKDITLSSSNINIKNSSSLIIGNNPSTGYTEFEKDGTIVFKGDATVYKDILQNLLTQSYVNPAADIALNIPEGNVEFKQACNLGDYAIMNIQINHDWKMGSDISPHLHWVQNSSDTPNWLIQYRWQPNGQPFSTTWNYSTIASHVFAFVTGTTMTQITGFVDISPPSSYGISDIVQFRVLRDGDNDSAKFASTDLLGASVYALNFDIHYEIDTIGSRLEYSK
jgi:hypothetical protein